MKNTIKIIGERGGREILYTVKILREMPKENAAVVMVNNKIARLDGNDETGYHATRHNGPGRVTTIFRNGYRH